jgi:hypothetical protein
MKKKKILRYSLLSLFILLAAAFYGYREFNRTHLDTAYAKPDFSLPATVLISEYESNEGHSNQKYTDKVIKVEGVVKDLTKDEKGFYSIALGDSASMSAVRCCIDSLHSDETAGVKKGEVISVKGICTGFNADELLGSDVILVRSVIDNKK